MTRATSSAPSQRMLRVGEQVRAAITQVLQRGEVRDPLLEKTVISISEVNVGQECGMAFENYEDIRAGDQIECFRVEHVTRTL